jgi:hypothetical protein
MLYVATLAFPFVLLLLLLWMDRVERPLRAVALADRLPKTLETAPANEVERLVSEAFESAVRQYWRRRRRARLLPGRRPA